MVKLKPIGILVLMIFICSGGNLSSNAFVEESLEENRRNENFSSKEGVKVQNNPDHLGERFRSRTTLLYSRNVQNDKWILDEEINISTEIHLYPEMYHMKEGNGKWEATEWNFNSFDQQQNMYVYDLENGQAVGVDGDLNYIAWYYGNKNGTYTKLKGIKIEKVD